MTGRLFDRVWSGRAPRTHHGQYCRSEQREKAEAGKKSLWGAGGKYFGDDYAAQADDCEDTTERLMQHRYS